MTWIINLSSTSRMCQFTQPISIADACLHTWAAGGWQRYYLTLMQWLRLSFVNLIALSLLLKFV